MTSEALQLTNRATCALAHAPRRPWTLGEDLLVYAGAPAGGAEACAVRAHTCLSHLTSVRRAGLAGRRVLDAPGVFSDSGAPGTPLEARPGGRALLAHCRRHPRDPLAGRYGLVLFCDGEPTEPGAVHQHTRDAQQAVGECGWWLTLVDGATIQWDMHAAARMLVALADRHFEQLRRGR